jgi:hypothetical protein
VPVRSPRHVTICCCTCCRVHALELSRRVMHRCAGVQTLPLPAASPRCRDKRLHIKHLASPSCHVDSPAVLPLSTRPSLHGRHSAASRPAVAQTPACGQDRAAPRPLHAAAASPLLCCSMRVCSPCVASLLRQWHPDKHQLPPPPR